LSSLLDKVQGFGFEIDFLVLDGHVHRFKTSSKPRKKNGWYVGRTINLRGGRSLEIVTVGDWALGETKTFTSRDDLTDADRKMFSVAAKKMQAEIEKKQQEERDKAAGVAQKIWDTGTPVKKGFAYLQKKKIETLKAVDFIRESAAGKIIIPLFNLSGQVRSLQSIAENGEKKYLPGGEVKGNFFPMKGSDSGPCVVCEGFATGASIYAALNSRFDVIVAFQSNNLFSVTAQMVNEYGAENVWVAADDDRFNEHNAGLEAAEKCRQLGVSVIVPKFANFETKPTDFNDLHCLDGLDEIFGQFEDAGFFGKSMVQPESQTPALAISSNEVATMGPEYWPSKDIGFYVTVLKPNGQIKLEPRFHELSKYFKHELRLRFSDAMVLLWDKTHYKTIEKTELLGLIHRLTLGQCQPDHLEKFLKVVRAECDSSQFDFLPTTNLVNLKNGVLNVKTKELSPHSPEFDFRYVLPFEFDGAADCPNWEKFLSEVFMQDQELVDLASEIFGYAVLGGEPFLHKCFMLYGIGRNGKSVFLEVLRAILGEKNCSNKPIETLSEKFSRSSLVGKLANISGETSKREIESSIFKLIVAGETIDASYKGKDEFDFRPQCRMFFSGNFFPTFKDSSAGMNDRLVLIPFNRYFTEEERDTGLLGRVLTELPGVFNWALVGLERLLKRGRLPRVKSIDELQDEYQVASCSVYGFMVSRCETLPESHYHWRKISDFYKPYLEYCVEQNIQPKSKISFGITLTSYLLKQFGNFAIRKNRLRFNETNRLGILGELKAVLSTNSVNFDAQILHNALTDNLRNYAEQKDESLSALNLPPNVIM